MIEHLREIGFAGLLFWSTWCVVSPRVNDGIIGKLFFMLVALGSVSAMMGSECAPVWVYVGVAAVFLRAYFMASIWPHLVAKFHRKA